MNPEKIQTAGLGAAVGFVACLIVMPMVFGWYSGGGAQKMANEKVEVANRQTLAPICAETFMRRPDANAELVALNKLASYERNAVIEKAVVIPGQKSLSYQVLGDCSDQLIAKMKSVAK